MLTFLARRLIASVLVLFAASYIVYVLTATAGDPLAELRTSTARNKEAADRAADHRAQPRMSRHRRGTSSGSATCSMAISARTSKASRSTSRSRTPPASTIQLLTLSLILAITIGILIGITSALRQYSGYDYSVTFLAFLCFSLPSFFIAVVLKAYVGIAFNDFLAESRHTVVICW